MSLCVDPPQKSKLQLQSARQHLLHGNPDTQWTDGKSGNPFGFKPLEWTPEMDAIVRAGFSAGAPYRKIAETITEKTGEFRSVTIVIKRCAYLGFAGRVPSAHVWTKPMKDRARELWPDHSAAQVADRINTEFGTSFTRNSVIGISSREKFPGKPRVSVLPANAWTLRKPKVRNEAREKQPRQAKPHVVPEIKDADIPQGQLRTILTIENGQCRFYVDRPGSDQLFCAATVSDDSPYCSHHHNVAHIPFRSRGTAPTHWVWP